MALALRSFVSTLFVIVGLALAALPTSAGAAGGFHHCGNIPSKSIWGLRADGVGCQKAKWVAKKYRNRVNNGGGFSTTFGDWRCTSTSYGDGGNVKCKDRGRGNDEVRFAYGG